MWYAQIHKNAKFEGQYNKNKYRINTYRNIFWSRTKPTLRSKRMKEIRENKAIKCLLEDHHLERVLWMIIPSWIFDVDPNHISCRFSTQLQGEIMKSHPRTSLEHSIYSVSRKVLSNVKNFIKQIFSPTQIAQNPHTRFLDEKRSKKKEMEISLACIEMFCFKCRRMIPEITQSNRSLLVVSPCIASTSLHVCWTLHNIIRFSDIYSQEASLLEYVGRVHP